MKNTKENIWKQFNEQTQLALNNSNTLSSLHKKIKSVCQNLGLRPGIIQCILVDTKLATEDQIKTGNKVKVHLFHPYYCPTFIKGA